MNTSGISKRELLSFAIGLRLPLVRVLGVRNTSLGLIQPERSRVASTLLLCSLESWQVLSQQSLPIKLWRKCITVQDRTQQNTRQGWSHEGPFRT